MTLPCASVEAGDSSSRSISISNHPVPPPPVHVTRQSIPPSRADYTPPSEQEEMDLHWMREALIMADEAFDAQEVPIGSIFVREGKVIARARNRTNELMNATRHAELEAIDYILSLYPPSSPSFATHPHRSLTDNPFKETTLYVTVEPCIMCSSALRQVGIKRVVFGAGNERFGGCGSVVGCHKDPALVNSPPFVAVGGYYREEAIMLLRKFYLTENVNAPNPKSKANRILKTKFQPPGVSMHGPQGPPTRRGIQRNLVATRSVYNSSNASSTSEDLRASVLADGEDPSVHEQQERDAGFIDGMRTQENINGTDLRVADR